MRIPISLSLVVSTLLLTACGDERTDPPLPEPVDYSQLNLTPQTEQPLVLADETRLSHHLKNGIRLQLGGQFSGGARDDSAPVAGAPPNAAPSPGESAGDGANPPPPVARVFRIPMCTSRA